MWSHMSSHMSLIWDIICDLIWGFGISTHKRTHMRSHMRSHISFQCNRSLLESHMRSHMNLKWNCYIKLENHPALHTLLYTQTGPSYFRVRLPCAAWRRHRDCRAVGGLIWDLNSHETSYYETSYDFLSNYDDPGNLDEISYEISYEYSN